MSNRLSGFTARMAEKGVEAALMESPKDVRYLTGYTGEGYLFVWQGGACILTDFRYVEQAERQSPGLEVVQYGGSGLKTMEAVAQCVKRAGVGKLAIEFDRVTLRTHQALSDALSGVELVDLPGIVAEMRIFKDAEELELIQAACRISCRAFADLLTWVRPGMTEKQVQVELDYSMLKLGAECPAFDTIACAGVNGSLPHAIPSDKVLEKGELLTLDFGAQYKGYKSDMTRTIAIGAVSDELRAIYDRVLEAQLAALSMLEEGVSLKAVDAKAREIIDADYPGRFGHSLGHGVGLDVHEQPGLNMREVRTLQNGHVVTIEPGIYVPGVGGCRIEDMGALVEGKFVNMIDAPKELITV